MKTIHLFLGLSVLTLLLFLVGACATSTQSATQAPELAAASAPPAAASSPAQDHDHAQEDGINRIKPADAVQEVKAGKALLVDVRDASSYETMHAKGAVNITYQNISDGKHDSLPKDKHLIFYCT